MSAAGRRGQRSRLAFAVAIAGVLTVLSAAVPQGHLVQGWVVDATAALRVALFGAAPPERAQVAVLGLDSRTLDAPGQLGWPRAMFSPVWAELAETAFAHGARGIAYDFIMAYDASALEIGENRPLSRYDDRFLRQILEHGRAGRMVLGRNAAILPALRFARVGGSALGLIDLPQGAGNVVREVPMRAEGRIPGTGAVQVLPTLTGKLLQPILPGMPDRVTVVPPFPLDSLPHVSILDVLECKDPAALRRFFEDRLIYVGSTLPGEDRLRGADRLMPRPAVAPPGAPCELVPPQVRRADESTLPGVFLHAAAADALLSGWEPRQVPTSMRLVLVAAVALAAAMIGFSLPMVAGVAAATGLGIAVLGGAAAALAGGWLLFSADPLLAVPLSMAPALVLRIRLIDRQAWIMRQTFGAYLSPVVIERMIETGALPRLDGGEARDVTVMFADLSGFTALSQTVDSATLMAVLNRYLEAMAREVRASGGYVDKYVGDAVMAVWNAPAPLADHPLRAIECGLAIRDRVEAMAAEDAARGRPLFKVKVGINSGVASVGNIGSAERVNYTVVGATVNLAARFESLPGRFRTDIVIGEATALACGGRVHLLELIRIRVKGAEAPVPAFAAFGIAGRDPAPDPALVRAWAEARACFEAGDFGEAAAKWDALSASRWPGAGPSAVMAGEARRRIGWTLDTPWDGAIRA